ncbi:peptide deformylase [Mycetocola reblochoni]|uniref:Peptide deformylase n=2 Tax=Mycetocola reblochoni TaxID=331618 RepID=A0A1R4IHP9_9MICO|nr:peptide deformylase [Mycetocola reblochoni]RLP69639.1 peptide deformylase [Mycetocola reblochoni]SJN19285.1 Peptide deformylase [Mycetocola reblochoni REB411]
MTAREIRVFGDPVLRTVCDPVAEVTPGVRALVEDLVDSVRLPGRAGVAATQIGATLRVFSYNIDGDVGYVINPVLAEVAGDPVDTGEGCLSVPELWFPVKRYPYARVTGTDLEGNPVEVSGTGLMAQALQHETDHLDGILYIQRLDKDTRREAMRRIRQSDWF